MKKNIALKIKRIFDIFVSVAGLIVFSPVIFVCAVIIRIKLGSPIIFKQKRVGKDNKVFEIIKFRTMKNIFDENGKPLDDEYRVTNIGNKIRSLSIDELPELVNVLKGDMSLIGPRPLLVENLQYYNDEQIRRHEVLPGLTGLAQVNGRNNLSWLEIFKFDIYYVDNWSLMLDIKIFFVTFYKVLKREGCIATRGEFNGHN